MNKTVLITGATSGIGLACARKFAQNGDRLILTGRNEQRLNEICKELTGKGALLFGRWQLEQQRHDQQVGNQEVVY